MVTGLILPLVFSQLRFRSNKERDAWDRRSTYRKFIEKEGIPVHGGYVADLNAIELKPWKRKGGNGAYVFLEGMGEIADAWVVEVEPGKQTLPQRHLYEEQILVLSGEGETRVWQNKKDAPKITGHWRKGSWFAVPLNAWHEHVNTGNTPARLAAVTTAPIVMDIFHDPNFIFGSDHNFMGRFTGENNYYDPENARHYPYDETHGALTITNLERNTYMAPTFLGTQGVGERDRHFILGDNAMISHIEEMEPGTYQRGHRHGPASVIVELYGTGYTLMWPQSAGVQPFASGNGDKVMRADWREGVMVVPPVQWYHQHFPSGSTRARWVRIGGRIGNTLYPVAGGQLSESDRDTVNYREEDPKIREIFEEEVRKNGATLRMPPREELLEMEREAERLREGRWKNEEPGER
ncbi:MAG: cupin domain-containing protein [Acidobacteria bacterium]|nr:cupin domain-containing protein [Acidobacteriota bacterium]